jgi:ribosomal protein S14
MRLEGLGQLKNPPHCDSFPRPPGLYHSASNNYPTACPFIKQNKIKNYTNNMQGRAVAEAVSRWLPTPAARVRARAECGVCGGQSGTGASFLRVLRFPLRIIPPISLSSKSPGACTIGLLVAAVPSEANWTPSPTILIYLKENNMQACVKERL